MGKIVAVLGTTGTEEKSKAQDKKKVGAPKAITLSVFCDAKVGYIGSTKRELLASVM